MPARQSFSATERPRLASGAVVADRFRIRAFLGHGGMGDVYEAEHRVLRSPVALKLLRPQRRERGGALATERLLREARAASRLSSPHIIRVLDAGVAEDGAAFIAMELLEGADLGALIAARGHLTADEAVSVIVEACEGLGEAHDAGIVHRDIKPTNLFLATNPRGGAQIKVLDFGVAKSLIDEEDVSATTTGSVIGSPRYMSPEQVHDPRRVDARTDVWSLGITLHELVTGRAPFEAAFSSSLCALIASEPPNISIDDELLPGLRAVVLRCLSKDRDARYPDARALGAALRELGGRLALPTEWIGRASSSDDPSTQLPIEPEGSTIPAQGARSTSPTRGKVTSSAAALAALAAVVVIGAAVAQGPSETSALPSVEPPAAASPSPSPSLPLSPSPSPPPSGSASPSPSPSSSPPPASSGARGKTRPPGPTGASSGPQPARSSPIDEKEVLKRRN